MIFEDTNKKINIGDKFWFITSKITENSHLYRLNNQIYTPGILEDIKKFSNPYNCSIEYGNRIRKGTCVPFPITEDPCSDFYLLTINKLSVNVNRYTRIKFKLYNSYKSKLGDCFEFDFLKETGKVFISLDDLREYIGEIFLSVKKYGQFTLNRDTITTPRPDISMWDIPSVTQINLNRNLFDESTLDMQMVDQLEDMIYDNYLWIDS